MHTYIKEYIQEIHNNARKNQQQKSTKSTQPCLRPGPRALRAPGYVHGEQSLPTEGGLLDNKSEASKQQASKQASSKSELLQI